MERPWTVPAAAGLLAVENVALFGGLMFSGDAPVAVLILLLAKFPLCVELLRARAAAAAILIVWETLTMGVALVNSSLTRGGQVALFCSAVVSSTLLALAMPTLSPARAKEA